MSGQGTTPPPYWAAFDRCAACAAQAGAPCTRMRMGARYGEPLERAHKGRPQRGPRADPRR